MIELLRTNDLVHLSWASAVLRSHGIEPLVLDQHAAAVEGSIGAIPRRLMVLAEDASRARWILETESRRADDAFE
ncbi:MAG: DUF2007 domain-containing protein [Alphaproteobacteria bacterium]